MDKNKIRYYMNGTSLIIKDFSVNDNSLSICFIKNKKVDIKIFKIYVTYVLDGIEQTTHEIIENFDDSLTELIKEIEIENISKASDISFKVPKIITSDKVENTIEKYELKEFKLNKISSNHISDARSYTNDKANYYYQDLDNYYICSCGALNSADNKECFECSLSKAYCEKYASKQSVYESKESKPISTKVNASANKENSPKVNSKINSKSSSNNNVFSAKALNNYNSVKTNANTINSSIKTSNSIPVTPKVSGNRINNNSNTSGSIPAQPKISSRTTTNNVSSPKSSVNVSKPSTTSYDKKSSKKGLLFKIIVPIILVVIFGCGYGLYQKSVNEKALNNYNNGIGLIENYQVEESYSFFKLTEDKFEDSKYLSSVIDNLINHKHHNSLEILEASNLKNTNEKIYDILHDYIIYDSIIYAKSTNKIENAVSDIRYLVSNDNTLTSDMQNEINNLFKNDVFNYDMALAKKNVVSDDITNDIELFVELYGGKYSVSLQALNVYNIHTQKYRENKLENNLDCNNVSDQDLEEMRFFYDLLIESGHETSIDKYFFIEMLLRGRWANDSYYLELKKDGSLITNLFLNQPGNTFGFEGDYVVNFIKGNLNNKRNELKIDYLSDKCIEVYSYQKDKTYRLYKR